MGGIDWTKTKGHVNWYEQRKRRTIFGGRYYFDPETGYGVPTSRRVAMAYDGERGARAGPGGEVVERIGVGIDPRTLGGIKVS